MNEIMEVGAIIDVSKPAWSGCPKSLDGEVFLSWEEGVGYQTKENLSPQELAERVQKYKSEEDASVEGQVRALTKRLLALENKDGT